MKTKLISGLLIGLTVVTVNTIFAKDNDPVELNADTIEYDSTKSIIIADGNVKITQKSSVITGSKAQFNTKTQEAYVTGGVKAVKEDTTLTAAEVRSLDKNHMTATGDVVIIKGESRMAGPKADYYADKQYAVITGGAEMKNADAVMTASQVEAFLAEDRAVGTGSVHITSDVRKLDARSNSAVYYGKKATGASGKLILSGNASATQEGNYLSGENLTIFLDDKAMNAQGRTKLIIKPQ